MVQRCAGEIIRGETEQKSPLLGVCSYDEARNRKCKGRERREREKRVGIKWGEPLISLAIHPRSVAQDLPRVLPRLIQHYEYFLIVVTPAMQREERTERDRE